MLNGLTGGCNWAVGWEVCCIYGGLRVGTMLRKSLEQCAKCLLVELGYFTPILHHCTRNSTPFYTDREWNEYHSCFNGQLFSGTPLKSMHVYGACGKCTYVLNFKLNSCFWSERLCEFQKFVANTCKTIPPSSVPPQQKGPSLPEADYTNWSKWLEETFKSPSRHKPTGVIFRLPDAGRLSVSKGAKAGGFAGAVGDSLVAWVWDVWWVLAEAIKNLFVEDPGILTYHFIIRTSLPIQNPQRRGLFH